MDKTTLSVYGLIVVTLMCMSVFITFATPYGEYAMEQTNVIIREWIDKTFTGEDTESYVMDAPMLSLNENTLTITSVPNATGYEVYNGYTLLTTTTETTVDLSTYITNPGIHVVHVIATSNSGNSETATIGYVLE